MPFFVFDSLVLLRLSVVCADASGASFMRRLSVLLPFGAALGSLVLFIQNMREYRERERRREEQESARIQEMEARYQPQDSPRPQAGPASAASNSALTFIPDPSLARASSPFRVRSPSRLQDGGYAAVAVHEEDAGEPHPAVDVVHSDDDSFSDGEVQGQVEDDAMDEVFDASSRSCSEWVDDCIVRLLSALAKPRAILLLNGLTYLAHITTSLMTLYPVQ